METALTKPTKEPYSKCSHSSTSDVVGCIGSLTHAVCLLELLKCWMAGKRTSCMRMRAMNQKGSPTNRLCLGQHAGGMDICQIAKAAHLKLVLENTAKLLTWQGPGATMKHMGTPEKPSCTSICCVLVIRLTSVLQDHLHAMLTAATDLYLNWN